MAVDLVACDDDTNDGERRESVISLSSCLQMRGLDLVASQAAVVSFKGWVRTTNYSVARSVSERVQT